MSNHIPEYPWLKLAGIRSVNHGECYITPMGDVLKRQEKGFSDCVYPVVLPDNIYNVHDLNTVPVPEGYELDGTQPWEYYYQPGPETPHIGPDGKVCYRNFTDADYPCLRICLRKIVPATVRWVILESCDPDKVKTYESETTRRLMHKSWSVRSEERPVKGK